MLDTLFANVTGKVALVALAVLLASTYVIRNYSPKRSIEDHLKDDYIATDSTFLYDTGRVTKMLKRYEAADYEAHESFILRWDLVYPLCYGLSSILILAYFCPWRGGWARWLVLLPLVTMAFDYTENFTMLAFLRSFRLNQQTPLTLLEVSRVFTAAKILMIFISFAVLIIFVVGFVAAHLRARTAAS